MTNKDSIIEYYNNVYDEDNRLGDNCDNRHKVEQEVKKRVLKTLFKAGYRVADIGAGTGLYTIFMAENGCIVDACDVVEKHTEIIKNKLKIKGLTANVSVEDAKELSYKSNKYDLVLLAGPIYHEHDFDSKVKMINESYRICKSGGYIVVDYLSDIHGFIQHICIDKTMISRATHDDMILCDSKDKVFSYDNKQSMIEYFNNSSLKSIKFIGTDGITRFIQETINEMTNKEIEKYIDFVYLHCGDADTVGLSEHCLCIVRKA